jgi:ABC-type antimicrobial peptide transport system permease subunit
VQQSLAESSLLAAIGASLGLAIAAGLSRAILRFLETANNSLHLDLALDWRMLAFTAIVASATCILLGLVPALRSSHLDPMAALRDE